MKLWVVGESTQNPEDWSAWSAWSEVAIVLAETAELACEIGGGFPATEISMDTVKGKLLIRMPAPEWGDDL